MIMIAIPILICTSILKRSKYLEREMYSGLNWKRINYWTVNCDWI